MNKKKLWVKIGIVVSAILFGFMICTTVITGENRTAVNNFFGTGDFVTFEPKDAPEQDTEYFKSKYKSVAELIEAGKTAAQNIEAEGAVLLKNENNALPLDVGAGEKRISLFGISSVDPAYGGRGSAQTGSPLPPVTPKEGFEHAGFEVNPKLYDFYASSGNTYKRVGRGTQAKINDAPWSDVAAAVSADDIAAYGDAAIMILTRVGGEGSDMAMTGTDGEDGNYLKLSEREKSVLTGMAQLKKQGKIKKIVVLLNVSNQLESKFLYDAEYAVDAALWIGCAGISGFNAVGDIVAGKVNPSGRLSDTFWFEHKYNPATYNFGAFTYTNAAEMGLPTTKLGTLDGKYSSYVVYAEGIYVGYRYAETRYYDVVTKRPNTGSFDYSKIISHPFGYGESYTSFAYSDYDVTDNADGTYSVSVKVTNTGGRAGREVVQVYVKKPFENGGLETPAVELVGYAKTETIAPNDSRIVSITVDKKDFAVYDSEEKKTYVIPGGEYFVAVGKNAHNAVNNVLAKEGRTIADGMDEDGDASLVKSFALDYDAQTYSKTADGKSITNLFDNADVNKYFGKSENSVRYLTRTDWTGSFPTAAVSLKMTEKLKGDLLAQDDPSVIPQDDAEYPKYNAKNGLKLIDLRVDEDGNARGYDDPMWDDLLDQLSWQQTVSLLNSGLQCTRSVPSIIKPGTREHNGPIGLTEPYGGNPLGRAARVGDPDKDKTAPYYPSIGILAATFDTDAAAMFGDMLGEDAIWAGYAGFYGIGLNTHRSPYGGRAYEYYSEDPLLAGTMAASEVKALQSHGCNAYVKHFALNDQEAQRAGISVWLDERTFREIYLKPFAIAVTDGGAMNAMSAFNRIGATHCPANKALLTDFLRGELGMKGLVVSDMYGIAYKQPQMPIFLMAGCDLPDGELDKENPYSAFKKNHGATAWQMREAAKRVLYATVQSNAMNSFSIYTQIRNIVPAWQIAVISLDCLFGAMFAASVTLAVLIALAERKKTDRRGKEEIDNQVEKGEKL